VLGGFAETVWPVEAHRIGCRRRSGQAEAGGLAPVVLAATAVRSGECWDRAESLERGEERKFPRPAGGHPECDGAGGACDSSRNGQ
jgi:hypothetical protein